MIGKFKTSLELDLFKKHAAFTVWGGGKYAHMAIVREKSVPLSYSPFEKRDIAYCTI